MHNALRFGGSGERQQPVVRRVRRKIYWNLAVKEGSQEAGNSGEIGGSPDYDPVAVSEAKLVKQMDPTQYRVVQIGVGEFSLWKEKEGAIAARAYDTPAVGAV